MAGENMTYPKQMPFPGQEPTIHIGKKPYYIGYIGLDRITKEQLPISQHADKKNIKERTAKLAAGFGLIKAKH